MKKELLNDSQQLYYNIISKYWYLLFAISAVVVLPVGEFYGKDLTALGAADSLTGDTNVRSEIEKKTKSDSEENMYTLAIKT